MKDVMDEFIESNIQSFARMGPYTIPQDFNLESIIARFQNLASAYSRAFFLPLLISIPTSLSLRLHSARADFALARTVFMFVGQRVRASPVCMAWMRYPFPVRVNTLTSEWTFNPLASKIISDVVTSGGWDPNVVTSSELDYEGV